MKLYAVPGHHNVIDTIVDATGLTSINGETFEQVRERYPLAQLYTWEEWRAVQMERQHTPIEWELSTFERYREMLEILPPAFWRRGLFLVGEPMDHDYGTGQPRYSAYWQRGDRYLTASRPITIAEAESIVQTQSIDRSAMLPPDPTA